MVMIDTSSRKHSSAPNVMDLLFYVQDTSLNLLFAGHDTSATAITLAVRHLKLLPHVLQKLRQEQQQVGKPTGLPRGGRGRALYGFGCN